MKGGNAEAGCDLKVNAFQATTEGNAEEILNDSVIFPCVSGYDMVDYEN